MFIPHTGSSGREMAAHELKLHERSLYWHYSVMDIFFFFYN